MSDFEVRGAEQFLRLSKALKEAGEKDLRREVNKGLRDAVKPASKKARQRLAAAVPARVSGRAAQTKIQARVRTGNDPGVQARVVFGKRGGGLGASNARLLNRGAGIRHPLYGNRDHWFTTPVPAAAGWFDRTFTEEGPAIRAEMERSLERVAEKVIREVKR